ncbi:hypothetical protein ONZ43_g6260 [Nemania bipapillata]|uniref:Uncharacterized protein n=1 Tax=Nemania bipapillata TaxID=110536 RepID=A0ACC2I1X9_9PEZI|nr:hypothetical protein ONZ43_g6260 [Nemania bipapillata]
MYALSIQAGTDNYASLDSRQDNLTAQIAAAHTRSDAKLADYVVALDVFDKREWGLKVIFDMLAYCLRYCDRVPNHINQTAYKPLAKSPIGLSIETKRANPSGAGDPLVQLGVWVAAWHKRMTFLRDTLIRYGKNLSQEWANEDLVSVPLIQVLGHKWKMYFARFTSSNITLYDPVNIGSTESIIQIYSLTASLEAINEWIKTSFKVGLERWFFCADVNRGGSADQSSKPS